MNVPFVTLVIMIVAVFVVTRKSNFGSFLSAVVGVVLGVVILTLFYR